MSFDTQWRQSIERVEATLADKRTWQDIHPETDVGLHLQLCPAYFPLKGWVMTKIVPSVDIEEERQRVFSFSEYPGEMDAFTFYPRIKGILGKIHEVVGANRVALEVQLDSGLSLPTDEDFVEFFDVTLEVFRRGLRL